MAWKNIFIPNITTEISSENLESNAFVNLGNSYDIVSLNNLVTIGSESVIYSKSDFKISIYTTTTPGATYEPYHPTYKVYYNNTLLASTEGFDCDIVGLALGFDYSSKRAKLRAVQRRYSTYPPTPSSLRFSIKETSWSDSVQQSIYNALVNVGLIILSGGAGSGYIGNAMLSNKKMVGYNIPTSSEASTYTESVNEAFENPVANKPKIGNGYARIKFLRESSIKCVPSITVGGQTISLMQINDFTQIPQSVHDATSFTGRRAYALNNSQPSWVASKGDIVYHSTQDTFNADEVDILDNQYFTLLCPSGQYVDSNHETVNGLRIYDKVQQTYISNWGYNLNILSSSSYYRDYYVGIIIDSEEQRGYIMVMVHNQTGNSSLNGYEMYMYGGVVNGVDYVYEAYHNLIR